jgi:hypothetical protein
MPPQGVLELSRIEPGLALQVGCTLSRRGEMIFDDSGSLAGRSMH